MQHFPGHLSPLVHLLVIHLTPASVPQCFLYRLHYSLYSLVSDYSDRGPSHVARLVVGQGEAETDTEAGASNPVTSEAKGRRVERSNSRVTRVSNLIKWPKNKEKEKTTAANLYVSDTSQV